MKSIRFPGVASTLTSPKGWPEAELGVCDPLPVARDGRMCTSVWKPSWRERFAILLGAKIVLDVVNGKSQPPVRLSTKRIKEI